jgi:hypothetical protein
MEQGALACGQRSLFHVLFSTSILVSAAIPLQRETNHDRLGKTFKVGLRRCRESSVMSMDQALIQNM